MIDMAKTMQLILRKIKTLSIVACNLCLILGLSFVQAQTPASASKTGWEGTYAYLHQASNSATDAGGITEYNIKLSTTSPKPCIVAITNAQQDVEIPCTARIEDASLILLFKEVSNSSVDAKRIAQTYKNGAPLIRFSKNTQGQLITTWLQLLPKDSTPRPPGRYFTQTLKQ